MTFSARLLFRARPRFKRFGDADRFFALAERSRAPFALRYNGFTTRQFYITEAIDGDGDTTYSLYDGNGQVTASVDGRGYTSYQDYDAAGQVTASVNADGDTTIYRYDGDGNQTAVIDPDLNTTTSAFDADDRLTETVSPTGGTALTDYDADGNVTETIAANGSSIVTSYDADDRVTQALWYEDDVTVDTQHQTYDNDGNLLTASNVNGTYSFSYDADDRLTQVSEPFAQTLQYAYDGDGNQTQVVDSFGGTQTSVYDLEDQLATREYTGEEQNLRVDFTYTAEGQIASETDYDNLAGTSLVGSTTSAYDADQNVTSIVSYNASDAVIESFKYTYDRAGNVGSETDTQQGTPTTITYSYDDANQLTAAGTDGYSYDANGNRTMTGYTTGPENELTSDGTYDYTYDASGEEITKTDVATGDKWTYEYNPGGQLASAMEQTSTDEIEQQVSYSYDVFSQLIETQTTVGDTTTTVEYAVDGWNPTKASATGTSNFDVWATFTSGGSLTAREIQGDGIDQHLAYVSSGGITNWYLTDHLGSTRAVVNNSATVADSIAYDAYGNITSQSSPSSPPMYTWDGYDYDAATGYYDNHARVYYAGT